MADSGSLGNLSLIGWRERVDLPEWGLRRVRAKIDTGARTSAIDVARIEFVGEDRVRFEVVARVTPQRKTRWVEAPLARTSRVKPSTGDTQERVVCLTTVRVGDLVQEIELGLVCRQGMLCRMLIGRAALAGHFIVDPSQKYLLTSPQPRGTNGTAP